jgi:hypothetical protein
MYQFSPTVAPAWPALGLGVRPCCLGLDHSICNFQQKKNLVVKDSTKNLGVPERKKFVPSANQGHVGH